MARKHKYHKGKFKPRNPHKYKGAHKNIIYRSGWELRYMVHLDNSPDIVAWSSEPFPIDYYTKHDQSWHHYWPDFWVKLSSGETYLVEVKPHKETKPPRKTKRKNNYLEERRRRYREVARWRKFEINQAKWNAARKLCEMNKWEFVLVTERELGLKNKKPTKAVRP